MSQRLGRKRFFFPKRCQQTGKKGGADGTVGQRLFPPQGEPVFRKGCGLPQAESKRPKTKGLGEGEKLH